MSRPNYVQSEHIKYLDDLRESAVINMFLANSWLLNAFPELDKETGKDILGYWMKTFGEDNR